MIYRIDLNYTSKTDKYGIIYQNMKCTISKEFESTYLESLEEVRVELLPKFTKKIKEFNKKNRMCWSITPYIPKDCLILCSNKKSTTLTNE